MVLLLLVRFRHNLWLWLTAVVSTWHATEHVAIIWPYLTTGLRGSPGLLAQGGLIGGGLPLTVVDLHYYYNLLETAPLVFAFLAECKRVYDERDLPRRAPRAPAAGRSRTCSSSYQRLLHSPRAARSDASRDRGPGRQWPGAPPGAPPGSGAACAPSTGRIW